MEEKDIQRLFELQDKRVKEKKLSDVEEGEFRILSKKYNAGYITRGETADLVNRALQQFEGRIAPFILAFNAIQSLLVKYDILTIKEIEAKKAEIVEEAKRRHAAMMEKIKLEQEKIGVENKKKLPEEKQAEQTEEEKILEKQISEVPSNSLEKEKSVVEEVVKSVVEKKDNQQIISFEEAKSKKSKEPEAEKKE